MLYFDDVSLPGHGNITGAFWSPDRRILAVTSAFRLLTEPPARAAYGGHTLRYRVSLYRPPSRQPIAVFDGAVLPINDVAFHPTKPLVALGAGSYDGGYFFHGQLVLWDWAESLSQSLRAIPEVKRLRFSRDGNDIETFVRPWDDGAGDGPLQGPYDAFFRLSFRDVLSKQWHALGGEIVNQQMEGQKPLTLDEVEAILHLSRRSGDSIVEIERGFALDRLRWRSSVWDVALLGSDLIGLVHDDCLLEVFDRKGVRHHSFKGMGHGVQIFHARETLLHVSHTEKSTEDWSTAGNARLLRLRQGQLYEVAALKGRYSFSMNRDGAVLGRCNRFFCEKDQSAALDVLLSPDFGGMARRDFGHCDPFNHYIRVDGAPHLFFVQGTPPSSHQKKYLCTVTASGGIERLWPLLPDAGDQASHALECCFGYINDSTGPGMIVAGRHYNSNASKPYTGFIYRKRLDGKELWRHATSASATSIEAVPDSALVIAAFLDGTLAVIRGDTGEIRHWEPFRPDGHACIIVSLDVDRTHMLLGMIDGRCGLMPLAELG
jgi:hypothetical protein